MGRAQTITVSGKITDFEEKLLANAKVVYGENREDYTLSDKDGNYTFKTELKDLKRITFSNKPFHANKTIVLQKKDFKRIKNNQLILNVQLNDSTLGVIIVGPKKPDTLFGTELYSVADFEIDYQNRMILLTYPKSLKKGSTIKLLDENQKVIDTYAIDEKAIELQTDYRKRVHLITKSNVFYVAVINNEIVLYREDKVDYFRYLSPILDTLGDNFYYSDFSDVYPAFKYFQFNKRDSVYTNLIEIIDKPLMEQYRAEFKFSDVRTKLWAHNKQIATGVDKEIWVGATVMANSIYYDPLYAPLFVNRDSIVVFDHYKNKLFTYADNLNFIDSVKINYHLKARSSGWQQPMIQDKEQGNIYALFERNGYSYLSLLNLKTGQVKFSRRLYFKYIEKIKVVDNKVYYIYRPYESIQKKYIYVEQLNV